MRSNIQTQRKSTLLFLVLVFAGFQTTYGKSFSSDQVHFQMRIDSLFQVSEQLCKNDSTAKIASSWVMRIKILNNISEDPDLTERYRNLDIHTEKLLALNKIRDLDKKNEFREFREEGYAKNAMELSNLGLEVLEASKKFNSAADAERAAEYFRLCLAAYKNTGKSQPVVDRFWKEGKLDWQWIRFYKAVALRKSGKKDIAQKEYGILINIGWKEPLVYLEMADLLAKDSKVNETQKILVQGNATLPDNIPLACALTRFYLETDQNKKAWEVIKPFDQHLQSNSELVLTKALVYEKKGDIKKADALFNAVYNSDPNEVEINSLYARYLLRKAKNAGLMEVDDIAQKAYDLVKHASLLSPENTSLKTELSSIKSKYPKVKESLN